MHSETVTDLEVLVGNLFKDGHLNASENELRDRIQRDSRDIRAAFKLGIITAGREDFVHANGHFTNVLAAGWKPNLARNNLAITYFHSGRTRTAIEILLEITRSKENPPAAAFFNLAVICDQIALFGGDIPRELIEWGLFPAVGRASDLAEKYYLQSLTGHWEAGLDGALYLWPEDIPPSLGFPIDLAQPSVEDAHRHLWEGLACLNRREWSQALRHFDLAASSRLYIDEAAKNSRTAALLGLCREIREDIAAKTASNDFVAAERRISELASLSAKLPVEDLLTSLLHEELRAIETRTWNFDGLADFAVLESYSRAIKTAVEWWTDDNAGDIDQQGDAAKNTGPAFARRCALAVERLLSTLVLAGRYDDSVELLDWTKLQWFGLSLKESWLQDINHAKALDFWSRAKDALAREKTAEAEGHLATALLAAQSIDDAGLQKIIERELANLHRARSSAEALKAIRTAISAQRYAEAAQLCSDTLRTSPHDEAIVGQEAIALNHLRADGYALARTAHWIESATAIDEYLRYRPGDREVQSFRESIAHQHKDALVEQGWSKWQARTAETSVALRQELERICRDVLRLYPHHLRALELVREMAVSEYSANAAAADTSTESRYQTCLIKLEEALTKNDPAAAFSSAWELRALRPFERHTKEACRKAVASYTTSLQTTLERSQDTSDLGGIESEIGRILTMEPGFQPAIELLREIQRRQVYANAQRRTVARDKLAEANQRLTDVQPVAALDTLEVVFVLDLAEFRTSARALRDLAIALAKNQAIAMLLDNRTDQSAMSDKIAAVLGRWAPEVWQDVLAAVARQRNRERRAESLRNEITRIVDQVRAGARPALRALIEMDRALRKLVRRYGRLSSAELSNLQAVRNDILQSMPFWSRCCYRVLARLTGSTSFHHKAANA